VVLDRAFANSRKLLIRILPKSMLASSNTYYYEGKVVKNDFERKMICCNDRVLI